MNSSSDYFFLSEFFHKHHDRIHSNRQLAEEIDVWEEYYEDVFKCEKKRCQNCEIEAGLSQYYLEECLFLDDKDKVIKIEASSSKLLHNSCSFYKCYSKGNGGSIYINNQECSVVQRRFCAIDSFSDSINNEYCRGLFSYVEVGENCLNYISESTLLGCGRSGTLTAGLTSQEDGNISLSNTNFTSCKACFIPTSAGKSSTSPFKFEYSTYFNNIADNESMIICTWSDSALDHLNIINNSQMGSYSGLIYHESYVMNVEFCSIINNKVPNDNVPLFTNADVIIVNNCYIDNSIPKVFTSPTEISNPKEYFMNDLTNLSLSSCETENPIIDVTNANILISYSIANIITAITNLLFAKK